MSSKKINDNWEREETVIGLNYDKFKTVLLELKKKETPDEIYVGCTFTYYNSSAHEIIRIAKKIFPDVKLTLGGIYPTLAPEDAKKSKADMIFTGSYPDTEDLPVNYDLLGYIPSYILIKGTRGCPHNCAYCAVHKLEGNKFCFRNPEEVFKEIKNIYDTYHIRELGIWDSNLLINYDSYFGKILKQIIESGMKMELYAPEGLDYRLLNESIVKDLRDSGFKKVSLALENFDDAISKKVNRNSNIKKLKETIGLLNKYGFKNEKIILFLIVGFPNQSFENVIRNIRFIWSLDCQVIIYPFTPIPGTKMFDENIVLLKNKPLKELHPFYFVFSKPEDMDFLIEIQLLNNCIWIDSDQKKLFKKLIHSKKLLKQLS